MKDILTIPEDIKELLNNGSNSISDESYSQLAKALENSVRKFLTPSDEIHHREDFSLRMSMLGKPLRYIWYSKNKPFLSKRENHLKFLYGNLLEDLVIWLLKQTGHSVTEEQLTKERQGIVGHQDCRINGIGVDIKSASSNSYRKLMSRQILEGEEYDPFGYAMQLSSYFKEDKQCAHLVVNKETGDVGVTVYNLSELPDPDKKIQDIKRVLSKTVPPKELCYKEKVNDNGNVEINTNCAYCPYKHDCFPTLRAFSYSNGIGYFTKVVKEPRVQEVDPKTLEPLSSGGKGGMFDAWSSSGNKEKK